MSEKVTNLIEEVKALTVLELYWISGIGILLKRPVCTSSSPQALPMRTRVVPLGIAGR